jgi:CxxC-x17-CxxC domain-containing protein
MSDFRGGSRFGGGNRGFRSDEPREMHKAVCSDCKQDCEVPFKPAEGKPVYCKECYSKHKPKRF